MDTFNGRITVTAGGEDAVDVRVTSRGSGSDQAEAEQDLAKVAVAITSTADRVTITARRTDQPVSLGDSGADVEITVPPASSLQLRTSNGRIEAANTSGSILARASNGAITTRGGRDLDLDTSNGPVSVNLAQGKLRVRTSNGALDIIAAQDAQVAAETSNAILTFSGSLAPGSNTFATSNANLTLTLPGDAAFTIDGATTNGRVQTDFPRLEVSDTAIRGTAGISSVTGHPGDHQQRRPGGDAAATLSRRAPLTRRSTGSGPVERLGRASGSGADVRAAPSSSSRGGAAGAPR